MMCFVLLFSFILGISLLHVWVVIFLDAFWIYLFFNFSVHNVASVHWCLWIFIYFSSVKVPSQHFNQVNILILCFFSHFVVSCVTFDGWSHIWLYIILVYREVHGQLIELSSCQRPQVQQLKKKPKSSPLCFTVGFICLCWYGVVGFLQMLYCVLWPKISSLIWSVQRTLLQRSCGLLRCSLPKIVYLWCENKGYLNATALSMYSPAKI